MKTLSLAAVLLAASCASAVGSPAGAGAAESPKASDAAVPPAVKLLAGKRVLVLGDSITQDGQYVTALEYFLQKTYPQAEFDIISAGLASETTSGLSEPGHAGGQFARPCVHERLARALAAAKPQVVVACYGMNDGIYKPSDPARQEAFRKGITRLVEACAAAGAQVVLVTPPVYEGPDGYDQVLRDEAAWEMKSPPKGVVKVVPLHDAMSAALAERRKAQPGFRFTSDKIHPTALGHFVMAEAILKSLEVPLPAKSAEELAKAAAADPLFALVRQRRADRSAGWLAHIGYLREKKVAPGTGDIQAVEAQAKARQAEIDALRKKAK